MKGGSEWHSSFFITPLQAELEVQWKLQACQASGNAASQREVWSVCLPIEILMKRERF